MSAGDQLEERRRWLRLWEHLRDDHQVTMAPTVSREWLERAHRDQHGPGR